MVAFPSAPLQESDVPMSRQEALVLITAVTIGASEQPPPDRIAGVLERVINRLLQEFDMTFEVCPETGNLLVDGMVIAEAVPLDKEDDE